jgi:diol dehydratase reactivase alpha subunit
MALIAGVDIGNFTTEVALAQYDRRDVKFIGSACVETSGIKGTPQNFAGIRNALSAAVDKLDVTLQDIDTLCLNDATPVIGDLSMATVTETLITDSAMIGHNPATPGGVGIGCGKTVAIDALLNCSEGAEVIAVVPRGISFDQAAQKINAAAKLKIDVQGAIVQNNDGVLISNRLHRIIPIVDEVIQIEDVPIGRPALVEVAQIGREITELCNPYSIATYLNLSAEDTQKIAPIAITLIGNKSAVVIKTPSGSIEQKTIPLGKLRALGQEYTREIDLSLGAESIMPEIEKIAPLMDVSGEAGTAVGGMLAGIKQTLSRIAKQPFDKITVRDLYAIDTLVPQKVTGGIAGEYALNKAIALSAMVWTDKSLMRRLFDKLQDDLNIALHIGGTEANMALLGALTTPGVEEPVVVLDMGAGSIDAARSDARGNVQAVHLAGAGDMVTMLIDSELGINNPTMAETIKIYPAAKVESPFHIRLEDDTLQFFKDPLKSDLFGRVVLLKQHAEMIPVPKEVSLKNLVAVRKNAKKKVFIPNVTRALKRIVPGGNIRTVDRVVLLGGCALDYEIPAMISEVLLKDYGVVTGRGNTRGKLGPRNAVATGLILAFCNKTADPHHAA